MHAKGIKLTTILCSDMSKQEIDMVSPCDLNGVSDEFFGSFFEHYDFPMEDLEGNIDWDALQLLQLPSSDELLSTSFTTKLGNENSGSFRSSSEKDVKPKINGGSSLGNSDTTAESNIFHYKTTLQGKDSTFFPTTTTTTCLSVLESGSSWSSGDNSLHHFGYQFFIPVKRARSKRLRPPTLNPRITMLFTSCLEKRKAKRKNFTAIDDSPDTESGLSGTRKCSHCEVTQTPQWREGPMGPKTLCNACGVRYRSGRLYPEYRPAASPTFVATVHSNSHKKVVEMRKKITTSTSKVENRSFNSSGCLSV